VRVSIGICDGSGSTVGNGVEKRVPHEELQNVVDISLIWCCASADDGNTNDDNNDDNSSKSKVFCRAKNSHGKVQTTVKVAACKINKRLLKQKPSWEIVSAAQRPTPGPKGLEGADLESCCMAKAEQVKLGRRLRLLHCKSRAGAIRTRA